MHQSLRYGFVMLNIVMRDCLNHVKIFESSFSIPINQGDFVQVKTDVICEGVFAKNINLPETITIYPNPVKNSFINTITSNSTQSGEIIIYNLIGQERFSKNISLMNGTNNINIDISNLQTGLYIYTLKTNKQSYTSKFIKE